MPTLTFGNCYNCGRPTYTNSAFCDSECEHRYNEEHCLVHGHTYEATTDHDEMEDWR